MHNNTVRSAKYLLTLLICWNSISVSHQAYASGVGFAVSVKSDDTTLYLPIEIKQQYSITPFIRYFKLVDKFYIGEYEFESREFGSGFYIVSKHQNNTYVYSGVRVSMVATKDGVKGEGVEKIKGYRLSPTFGVKYLINKHLSVSGEISAYYLRLKGEKIESTAGEEPPLKSTDISTSTRMIFAYHF